MSDLVEQRLSRLRNPVDDSDWNDVQRKARRPIRHAVIAVAVAATTALLVAPAFGIGDRVLDLIQGPKAPPEVQTSFTANDTARKRHYAFAEAAGAEMHDRFSPVVPGAARGITTIETADGPIQLWAAPTEDGRQCWLVQTGADPATGRPYGGGSCDGIDRAGPIRPDGPAWTIERPHLLIMHVRIYDDDITRVQLEYEGADELSLPVASGHALGTIPEQEHVRLRSVAGLNADGEVIAQWAAPR